MGQAHMGQGPYGPRPIWARAPGPGPGARDPGPRAPTRQRNPHRKSDLEKTTKLCFLFYIFMETKKNRSAITINLPAVSRRHLLYEVQSCKKSYPQKTYTRLVALPQGLFFPQKTYTRLVALPQGLFFPQKQQYVSGAPLIGLQSSPRRKSMVLWR